MCRTHGDKSIAFYICFLRFSVCFWEPKPNWNTLSVDMGWESFALEQLATERRRLFCRSFCSCWSASCIMLTSCACALCLFSSFCDLIFFGLELQSSKEEDVQTTCQLCLWYCNLTMTTKVKNLRRLVFWHKNKCTGTCTKPNHQRSAQRPWCLVAFHLSWTTPARTKRSQMYKSLPKSQSPLGNPSSSALQMYKSWPKWTQLVVLTTNKSAPAVLDCAAARHLWGRSRSPRGDAARPSGRLLPPVSTPAQRGRLPGPAPPLHSGSPPDEERWESWCRWRFGFSQQKCLRLPHKQTFIGEGCILETFAWRACSLSSVKRDRSSHWTILTTSRLQ